MFQIICGWSDVGETTGMSPGSFKQELEEVAMVMMMRSTAMLKNVLTGRRHRLGRTFSTRAKSLIRAPAAKRHATLLFCLSLIFL